MGQLPQGHHGCDHLRSRGIYCRRRVKYRIVGPHLVVSAEGKTKETYKWNVLYDLKLAYCDAHCPAALRAAIEGRVGQGGGVRTEEKE